MNNFGVISAITSAPRAAAADAPAAVPSPAPAETAPETGGDFSALLESAMKEEMVKAGVTAGTGTGSMQLPGGLAAPQMQNQGIEQLILEAAASGEVTDAQTAMLMLCMMMQSNQDGDFSMIMQMMASMLTQVRDESGEVRQTVMASKFDPYVLDTVDWNVFGSSLQGVSGDGQAVLPLEFWRPTTPSVVSTEGERDPALYNSVIGQFRVETAERYRPFRNGYTYCNIYMWDVTSAMGAEIPHYTDPNTGEAMYYPDTKGAKSMTAKEIDVWLRKYGSVYGWKQVDAETAQQYANEGKPAVTTSGNIDHVQVVCPSKDGEFDPIRGVTVAQAGSKVTGYTHISSIYGADTLKNKIIYWVHE